MYYTLVRSFKEDGYEDSLAGSMISTKRGNNVDSRDGSFAQPSINITY